MNTLALGNSDFLTKKKKYMNVAWNAVQFVQCASNTRNVTKSDGGPCRDG